jgi:RecA-family ATPase
MHENKGNKNGAYAKAPEHLSVNKSGSNPEPQKSEEDQIRESQNFPNGSQSSQQTEETEEQERERLKLEHQVQASKKASEFTPKPIKWLWPGKIPSKKITILVGQPDTGKSFLTCELAARISNGTNWPDGHKCEQGEVLMLTAEDDPEDTVIPRLDKFNANKKKIQILSELPVYDPKKDKTEWQKPSMQNMEALGQEINLVKPELITIDVMDAYLDDIDGNSQVQMRSKVYEPLKKLAEKYECCIMLLMHFNKKQGQSAKERISGSISHVGAARSVWLLSKDEEYEKRIKMLPVKNNLSGAKEGQAFEFTKPQGSEEDYTVLPDIEWENETISETAEEVVQSEGAQEKTTRERAKELILEQLDEQAKPAEEIYQKGVEQDLSRNMIYRAKRALNVEAEKGSDKVWRWSLPE